VIINERVRHRLAATTRFGAICEWDSIDSTNRWLVERAAGGAPEGTVAVADHQTAGRGRLGRRWEAPAGSALMVSLLLRPALAPGRLHLVTAAVGLAAREACLSVAGVGADLKWPNDLLVGEEKLAGVLAEGVGGAVVVGLGLNVSWAPPGATCLTAQMRAAGRQGERQEAGRGVDRGELLGAVLAGVEARYGAWDEVAGEYRAACATVGRRVRVAQATGDLVGTAVDIDRDGRLVVVDDAGRSEAISAGDVVHLRPA
jgi:BirA family transcriptional regulator, biotin operon repressor / biotin---[acetyl-CoA-carboxylase] ligase